MDPGEDGLGDSGSQGWSWAQLYRVNGLSSRAGMRFLMLPADSTGWLLSSWPHGGNYEPIWIFAIFSQHVGEEPRRALINQLQTCSVDKCVCLDSNAFLALRVGIV